MIETEGTERVIDVADIERRLRHNMIGQLFKHPDRDLALQIVVDHDPQRLRFHLDLAFGTQCEWSYLEQGPDVWRVGLRYVRKNTEAGTQSTNAR